MAAPSDDDDLLFIDDAALAPTAVAQPWIILVVDDDANVHAATRLVLNGFHFRERPLQLHSCYSFEQAATFMRGREDVAVILLDVVMETADAGLRLVGVVREELGNASTRIILRTGQPGYLPELEAISRYEIDDYKDKSQLTGPQLINAVTLALRAFDLVDRVSLQMRESLRALQASNQELAAAQSRLLTTQRQLLQQEKLASLGTLTAGVAHEINNPAQFINGAAQNLEVLLDRFRTYLHRLAGDDADPAVLAALDGELAPLREQVDTVLEGAARIGDIVRELRQFSRSDEGVRRTVPLSEPIRSTVHLLRTRYDRIEVTLDLDRDRAIECQPARLGQVFMNLLVNALQAVEQRLREQPEPPGRVSVRIDADAAAGMLIARVEDNGIGMDEVTRQRAFEAFFTTKDASEGTGLGLSLSASIIAEHGGRIEVSSRVGEGSCFAVYLPLAHGPAPP